MDRRPIAAQERTKPRRVAIPDTAPVDLRDRYLDLLEQTLAHTAYARLDLGRTGANPLRVDCGAGRRDRAVRSGADVIARTCERRS